MFAFENDIFLGKENLRNPIMNPSSPLGARYRGKMEMEGGGSGGGGENGLPE